MFVTELKLFIFHTWAGSGDKWSWSGVWAGSVREAAGVRNGNWGRGSIRLVFRFSVWKRPCWSLAYLLHCPVNCLEIPVMSNVTFSRHVSVSGHVSVAVHVPCVHCLHINTLNIQQISVTASLEKQKPGYFVQVGMFISGFDSVWIVTVLIKPLTGKKPFKSDFRTLTCLGRW